MAKFVRYGPAPRYGQPEGGFCASSFAIVRSGRKVLLGMARAHQRWEEEWAPNFAIKTPEELDQEYRSWRFPASYLYEGESPDGCLERIMSGMLEVRRWSVARSSVHAFYDPSSLFPGEKHYDLCFVYDVKLSKAPAVPPWFSRLEFLDPRALRSDEFGSSMGDLAKALKLAKR